MTQNAPGGIVALTAQTQQILVLCADYTVKAISIFNDYAGAGSHVDVGWLQIEVKQQQTIISPPIVAQEVRESRERVREEGRYSLSFPVRWLIPSTGPAAGSDTLPQSLCHDAHLGLDRSGGVQADVFPVTRRQ